MFPYRDDNPTLVTPVATLVLIATNLLVWFVVQGMGQDPAMSESVCRLALIPGDLLGRIPDGTVVPIGPGSACVMSSESVWYTMLSSMFLHGGWLHLIGNMWFLWVFGNNVEDSMGRIRYLVFYLLCGLAAAGLQTLFAPSSAIPMLGASGAIGGVMGAYVLLYPRVRVHMLVVFVTRIQVPAFLMLGYWFLLQLVGGAATAGSEEGGVAFWAHVGGFLAGALLITLFKDRDLVARHRALAQTM